MRKFLRSPITWVAVVVVAAAALYWFQPWRLWIDQRVDEQLPDTVAESPQETESASARPDPEPVLLAAGEFVSQEHPTAGRAELVRQPDGSVVLAIAGLETSNGPDLRVWLTDQAVDPDEWFVFDDGYHVELAPLKGNLGDQVYEVPADVDLDKVDSVSIWCARFAVSFGAAALE
ncbi:electron transfer DM13 [Stackebrandtia albiflava]|uniref:Electron transfer DM13 n=1 Tax=Stackebrandtia albiflava TaxID=406432 RepID=A0A562VH90_9ACTN|nr:DM13 domain-containing protein [Stackebrandtia albiflava]TWJ17147.1 electron transfer DM13 [Stackebrandtia albiflava]